MPQTSSGETVYADPEFVEATVQTDPQSFSLSTTADGDGDGVSDWREYLESLQTKAKGRIDDFCRRDFELHENETVTLDGGDSVLFLPSPVRTVAEVRVDGSTLGPKDFAWKDSGALLREGRSGWADGFGNVEVTLDYGYATPPGAVAEAEAKLVDHTVVGQAQKREGMIVQGDSFEVEVNIPVAWNREIAGMLKPHRKMGVFS